MRAPKLLALMLAISWAEVSGQPPSVSHLKYVGCFTDTSDNRDLKGLMGYSNIGPFNVHASDGFVYDPSMTLELCSRICAMGRFHYFGAQARDFCFCGSSYGLHGSAPESECSQVCGGNASQVCGGQNINSVFENIYNPPRGVYKPMASNSSILVADSGTVGAYLSQEAALKFECFAACHRSPDCLACAFVQSSRMCRLMRFAAVPSEVANETQWVWVKM